MCNVQAALMEIRTQQAAASSGKAEVEDSTAVLQLLGVAKTLLANVSALILIELQQTCVAEAPSKAGCMSLLWGLRCLMGLLDRTALQGLCMPCLFEYASAMTMAITYTASGL